MDPLSAFLYFGLPTTVGLIGLAAVKLHERSAPPEAVGDDSAEEYVPAFVRRSSLRKAADRRRVVGTWDNPFANPPSAYTDSIFILRKAVAAVRQRSAEGSSSDLLANGPNDATREYDIWFRETYGPTADPAARNPTADEIEVFVRWLNARWEQAAASNAQSEDGPGRD